MLDTQKQIDAFKLLQGHNGSAHSVDVSGAMVTTAKAKADALTALKTTTPAVTYPATVTLLIARLDGYAAELTNASNAYKGLHGTLSPFNEIDELVNLSIGFDCWVKAYGHPVSTPFALVEGLAEITKVDGLKSHVDAFDATAITTALNAINAILIAASSATPTPGVQPPTVAQTDVDALTVALDGQQATITAMAAATALINDLNSRAGASITQAQTAFHDAIEIALIEVLKQDPRMAGAITALVPANVLAALK
ncbi:hypothetical protein NLN92_19435 [Citrobacter portucalensis]|uniref:hypothetical protein n=1 Tax=Citrobacter portucalensis TaxID=1639133 RepID=UPI00226B1E7B|nr:hypothetical protein [Citrobacter portucalensis]MCX8980182.1 hypothetical protein [Citrobacter portucalensis]